MYVLHNYKIVKQNYFHCNTKSCSLQYKINEQIKICDMITNETILYQKRIEATMCHRDEVPNE